MIAGRYLSDADGIVDGVVIQRGTYRSRHQEKLITDCQVAFIRSGAHVPRGMAVRVSMVEVLVQIVHFTDCTMVIHLITGVVFGDVFPVSGCIVHARPRRDCDIANAKMLHGADRIAQAPSHKFPTCVEILPGSRCPSA